MPGKVCSHGRLYVLCKECEETGIRPGLGNLLFATLSGKVEGDGSQRIDSEWISLDEVSFRCYPTDLTDLTHLTHLTYLTNLTHLDRF